MKKVIGISGRAEAGKTTFANVGVDYFGFTKLSFAGPLKDEVREFLEVCDVDFTPEHLYGARKNEKLLLILSRIDSNHEAYQYLPKFLDTQERIRPSTYAISPRELMQWWGTEFRRRNFGEDYWIKKMEERIREVPGPVVIDDMRFQNELALVKYFLGVTIRVERPGHEAAPLHASETALDRAEFDERFMNCSSLHDFQRQAYAYFAFAK